MRGRDLAILREIPACYSSLLAMGINRGLLTSDSHVLKVINSPSHASFPIISFLSSPTFVGFENKMMG